jgi:2-oxoisovalerate dehydrogenase E1 component alpha subunit
MADLCTRSAENGTVDWGTPSRPPGLNPFQRLATDGTLDAASLLETPCLIELFRLMVLTRALDEEAIHLQRQGQLGVYASSRGQEAVQVGVTAALERGTDWLFPSYRELGAAVVWGIEVKDILHMWRGTWFSSYDVDDCRAALQSIPVATQLLHAVGFAKGMKLQRHHGAVLAYVGDGSTSEGDFHEALNFAGVWQVPCVFVIQNNQYAISVPLEKQTAAERLAYRGVGYGVPAAVVDGNDVVACREVAAEALDRARSGGGPSLIEALTYRMEAHTTSDDPSRYRDREEEARWTDRDPLLRLERLIRKEGFWTSALQDELQVGSSAARRELRESIYDAAHGDPMELFEHVYVDPDGHFEDQREQLRAELDQRAEDGGDA